MSNRNSKYQLTAHPKKLALQQLAAKRAFPVKRIKPQKNCLRRISK